MYEDFFGLAARPFAATPDPDCFVDVPQAAAALQDLLRCAVDDRGIGILTGPSGIGKTLLCHQIVRAAAPTLSAFLVQTAGAATRRALWQNLLFAMQQDYSGMTEQEAKLRVLAVAQNAAETGDGLLLVIDEAHRLSPRLLEELRSLTNHIRDGRSIVRLILAGPLELEEALGDPALQALNQRIGCCCVLEPLSMEDSYLYVAGRVAWAKGAVDRLLTEGALRLLCRSADGSPRGLNQICDHSLLLGYVAEERPVTESTVRSALQDLRELPLDWTIPAEEATEGAEPSLDADDLLCGVSAPSGGAAAEREESVSAPSRNPLSFDFGEGAVFEFGGDTPAEPPADHAPPTPHPVPPAMHAADDPHTPSEPQEILVEDHYARLDRSAMREPRRAPAAVQPAADVPHLPPPVERETSAPLILHHDADWLTMFDDSPSSDRELSDDHSALPEATDVEVALVHQIAELRREIATGGGIEPHPLDYDVVMPDHGAPNYGVPDQEDPIHEVAEHGNSAHAESAVEYRDGIVDRHHTSELDDVWARPSIACLDREDFAASGIEPPERVDDSPLAPPAPSAVPVESGQRRFAQLFTRLRERRKAAERTTQNPWWMG